MTLQPRYGHFCCRASQTGHLLQTSTILCAVVNKLVVNLATLSMLVARSLVQSLTGEVYNYPGHEHPVSMATTLPSANGMLLTTQSGRQYRLGSLDPEFQDQLEVLPHPFCTQPANSVRVVTALLLHSHQHRIDTIVITQCCRACPSGHASLRP